MEPAPCYVAAPSRFCPWVPEVPTALRLVIELAYDAGCPHVDQARAVLTRALQEAGVPAVWKEWCADDPASPPHIRNLGSPTVLVNGKDVAPGPHPWAPRQQGQGPRCRLYQDGTRSVGAPPVGVIVHAVLKAMGPDIV